MNTLSIEQLDWEKMAGLIPAIIQHAQTGQVLMLGYMNQEALSISMRTNDLTLYSRSKQRLWRKGETSGHTMRVMNISTDCDGDGLLVQVNPTGPGCHLGFTTCFQPAFFSSLNFISELINVIAKRAGAYDLKSYTAQLLSEGLNRCAQKVGEEAVETVIAAVSGNKAEIITETADLMFHLLVLLQASQVNFYDVLTCLQERHQIERTS